MSDDFDPEVLRELEENFRMISATAGALSGTLDKLNVGAGGQSQSQREETDARKENTSSINAQMRVQEAAAKATAEMAERQKNFSEASAKSTDALVGLTTAMIDGKGKFADFNKGLGDAGDAAFALGKNFGPVGMIIGGLVKGATMAAQEMTRLSDAQVTLTKDLRAMGGVTGVSSDELFRLGNEAGITAENFVNISRMAQDASSALTSLGGTSGEGQRQMLEMFKVDKKTRMAFARTGIDLEDLQEGMKDYLKLQEASGFQLGKSDKTSAQIQRSSMEYVTNLQVLSDLTGKRIAEIKEEQQRVASQLREQMEVRRVEIEISKLRKEAAAAGDPVEKARLEGLAENMQAEQDMRQKFMSDATAQLGAETATQLSKVMRTGAFDQDSVGLSQLGINPNELKERFAGMDEGSDEYREEFAKFMGEFKEGQNAQIERIGTAAQFANEDQIKRLLGGTDEQSFKLASKIADTPEEEIARQATVRDAQAEKMSGDGAGEGVINAQVALQETQRDLATAAERVIQGLNPLTGELGVAKVAMTALTVSAGAAAVGLGAMSLTGPLGKAATGLTGMFKGFGGGLKTATSSLVSGTKTFGKDLSSSLKSATGHLSKIGPALKDIPGSLKNLGPQITKGTLEATKAGTLATQKGLQSALGVASKNMGKMLGGAGLGALTAGIFEVFEYQKDAAKIDEDLKKGLLTNAEAEDKKQNEMGEGIGTTAGAAIGTAIGALGGPLGMAIGGFIGSQIGGLIGDKITEEDKPEANRKDLNAARKLDVYDEDSFGNSEIDFDRLEETMLSGQLKPEMLEAMLLDDDLGEEDQAKLVSIMDEFREAGQVFEMDKTAKEREETLAKEKLARDEKELADKKKRSDAMAALVDKELDDSKKTAGNKAEADAAELARKELAIKGQEDVNARIREFGTAFTNSGDVATKAIDETGKVLAKDVTVAGEEVTKSGPSFMGKLFDGLLSAINPVGGLFKKGLDFFGGKDDEEETLAKKEGAMSPNDPRAQTLLADREGLKTTTTKESSTTLIGGDSEAAKLLASKPGSTTDNKVAEKRAKNVSRAARRRAELMAMRDQMDMSSGSASGTFVGGKLVQDTDDADDKVDPFKDTLAKTGVDAFGKKTGRSTEEFKADKPAFVGPTGFEDSLDDIETMDFAGPDQDYVDPYDATGKLAKAEAPVEEQGPGMFASMIDNVKSMIGGLFGGSDEPEFDIASMLAEIDATAGDEDDGSASAMAFIDNMKAEREEMAQNLGLIDLAREATPEITAGPDARSLLAQDTPEDKAEKGKSESEATAVKNDQNSEMLDTLRMIAQNGSEQNAKLSAIAEASEAGVNVNKKIYASTNV